MIYRLLAFLVSASLASSVFAQESQGDLKEKLANLQSEVSSKSSEIGRLSELVNTTKAQLHEQASRLKALRQEEVQLREELQETEDDIANTQNEKERVQRRIEEVRVLTRKRLKALYVQRWESVFDRLMTLQDSGGFERTSYFVGKLRSFDQSLLEEHTVLNNQLHEKEEALMSLNRKQSKLVEDASKKRIKTESLLEKNKKLISQYEKQREELEELLLSLQSQALRLETIVSSLTYGGMEFVARNTSRPKTPERTSSQLAPFDGRGLVKGSLTLPVHGKVLRTFGKRKHANFSDYVFQKGIEYLTEPGSDVVSVQEGKVIYKGKMPAFGTILIIDHGKRFYSLYGRLATVRATPGDLVEK
ncbi:MAG: peptidoglycan DD-metalloendopeptidase family protein, partial [Bdellovibrionales bacterium]|nr:peptidoglycan DD-metalloendopeptidase family protein [Bdellovibrionales bacterium]